MVDGCDVHFNAAEVKLCDGETHEDGLPDAIDVGWAKRNVQAGESL
jgi:hypothetical protein